MVVFAGYLAGKDYLKFSYIAISIITGNLLSAIIMYYFGLEVMDFMVKRLKSEKLKKIFSREALEKTHVWFERYGFWAVVFSRFSAGIRFFVAIIAGMVRMPIALFIFAFLVATLLWNSLLVYGGYVLGKNWNLVMKYLQLYNGFVAIVILVIVGVLFARYYKKGKSS